MSQLHTLNRGIPIDSFKSGIQGIRQGSGPHETPTYQSITSRYANLVIVQDTAEVVNIPTFGSLRGSPEVSGINSKN
jgi:hypothetical protein